MRKKPGITWTPSCSEIFLATAHLVARSSNTTTRAIRKWNRRIRWGWVMGIGQVVNGGGCGDSADYPAKYAFPGRPIAAWPEVIQDRSAPMIHSQMVDSLIIGRAGMNVHPAFSKVAGGRPKARWKTD